ncbi:MAG: TAXI family TRAP transporter solute-binding subunit [Proteobacteria bacterium]|nr:TAXI family TRAP transporter solute-binding subunit [Pseudomonadota bacterium]
MAESCDPREGRRPWRPSRAALGALGLERWARRVTSPVASALLAVLVLTAPGQGFAAEDLRFFRIGTGSTSGIYFPIGGLIASAISNPPGSRACDRGGSCGVPGLIAVAQATHGSVDNVKAMAKGDLESGLSQADIAYWSYTGKGMFHGKNRITNLRAIANLYPESVHIVAREDAGIKSVKGLKGKRVSLDVSGSGTQVNARLILKRYGVGLKTFRPVYVQLGPAIDMMREGRLDAFFFVAGYPVRAIAELAERVPIQLVPIMGKTAKRLRRSDRFFSETVIPAGTYKGVDDTPTLSVGAQWIVRADVDEKLVYGITRALWHKNTRPLLDSGHPNGRLLRLETALDGIAIPLHPGAERYYREAGLIPVPDMGGEGGGGTAAKPAVKKRKMKGGKPAPAK